MICKFHDVMQRKTVTLTDSKVSIQSTHDQPMHLIVVLFQFCSSTLYSCNIAVKFEDRPTNSVLHLV